MDQDLVMRLVRRLAAEARPPAESSAQDPKSRPDAPLTPRELEVLRLIVEGETNRRISHKLHLSLSTVKRNLERIIAKLGVSDRTQAAVRAVELGLLDSARD